VQLDAARLRPVETASEALLFTRQVAATEDVALLFTPPMVPVQRRVYEAILTANRCSLLEAHTLFEEACATRYERYYDAARENTLTLAGPEPVRFAFGKCDAEFRRVRALLMTEAGGQGGIGDPLTVQAVLGTLTLVAPAPSLVQQVCQHIRHHHHDHHHRHHKTVASLYRMITVSSS
jgi:hypothetical protein